MCFLFFWMLVFIQEGVLFYVVSKMVFYGSNGNWNETMQFLSFPLSSQRPLDAHALFLHYNLAFYSI